MLECHRAEVFTQTGRIEDNVHKEGTSNSGKSEKSSRKIQCKERKREEE